jgi:hypothetical protein
MTALPEQYAVVDRPCAEGTPLEQAYLCLWRAGECGSSMLRADYLFRARDALNAAGMPRWADLAESAARRIGGDGQDMRRLMLDIDCARRHRSAA